MVDLVKIRKKAKEKKEAEEGRSSPESTVDAVADGAKPRRKSAARKSKPSAHKAPDKNVARAKSDEQDTPPAPDKSSPDKQPEAEKAEPVVAAETESAEEPGLAEDDATEKSGASETEEAGAGAGPEDEPAEESLDRLEKFKREAGKRRHWASEAAARGAIPAAEEEESGDLELLRFSLAGEEYAVDIEKIVEIVPPRGTTRVPNADPTIVGIMSLRGTIVTVFDLRRKLGHPPIDETERVDRRLIVVEREGETAGFLVDKVSRVVKLDPSEIENHPVVSAAEQSDYVGGVFQATDGLVILLDLEKILAGQN